jgi:hypothetical protein
MIKDIYPYNIAGFAKLPGDLDSIHRRLKDLHWDDCVEK